MRSDNQASTDDGDVPRGETGEQERPNYRVSGYTVYPTGYDRVAAPAQEQWRVTVMDADDGLSIRWRSRCLNASGWPAASCL